MATSKLTAMLENIAPIDIGADDISLDDDYERAWTSTPHKGNRGGEARSPLTPTLSLPDSFDGEYGGSGGNQQTPFNRDVEVKKMRAEVARVKELLQDRQGMFRDLVRALCNSTKMLLHVFKSIASNSPPSPQQNFLRKYPTLCTSSFDCGPRTLSRRTSWLASRRTRPPSRPRRSSR